MSTRADDEDRDPGLARARTELAWTRTAVSFAAVGTGMLRTSGAVGVFVMALGAVVCGLGYLSPRPSLVRGRSATLLTVASTLVSVLALVVAVTTVVRTGG